jgi:hypothetical protein
LDEIRRVITHHYPDIQKMVLDHVRDPRRKKSITYSISELVLACVYLYMMRSGSRNSVNEEGQFHKYKQNYRTLFGLKLPHMDTVDDLFEKLDDRLLEGLKVRLIKRLLHQRVLHKFRFKGQYFIVAIDGTGIYKFDKSPYDGCPFKTSKNGKVTYHQPVVEAKLVCANGFSMSLATEFVTNSDGKEKQDCEYNATVRIIKKLKAHFPRLPIMIVLDGLYAKAPIMKAITSNEWQFGIVWKDKTLYELQEIIGQQIAQSKLQNFDKIRSISKDRRIECTYTYSSQSMDYKNNTLYYAGVTETTVKIKPDKTETKIQYKYLISTPPDRENIIALVEANRMRWKIENEGFNVQKNNGFELHHKMNRHNLNAIKNYYHCLQMANIFNQLILLCKNTTIEAYGSAIKLWEYFSSELRILDQYNPPQSINQKINLRY